MPLTLELTSPDRYASTGEMLEWAKRIMRSRQPDVVIGGDYLRRWWIAPRNAFANVYLHEFRRSDDDRAMHDHPWANSSLLISGRYIEHTPAGQFLRVEGDFVERSADALHRIELIGGQPTISLFMTGPKIRESGFACENGWVHWPDFLGASSDRLRGPGCGE